MTFRRTFRLVDLDPFHATAWRVFFQDVAGQILVVELLDSLLRKRRHALGQVDVGARGLQVDRVFKLHQLDGLAGRFQTDFDFGANRHPLKVRASVSVR
jgi:DNA polymerase III epsilon subunit-like protein